MVETHRIAENSIVEEITPTIKQRHVNGFIDEKNKDESQNIPKKSHVSIIKGIFFHSFNVFELI